MRPSSVGVHCAVKDIAVNPPACGSSVTPLSFARPSSTAVCSTPTYTVSDASSSFSRSFNAFTCGNRGSCRVELGRDWNSILNAAGSWRIAHSSPASSMSVLIATSPAVTGSSPWNSVRKPRLVPSLAGRFEMVNFIRCCLKVERVIAEQKSCVSFSSPAAIPCELLPQVAVQPRAHPGGPPLQLLLEEGRVLSLLAYCQQYRSPNVIGKPGQAPRRVGDQVQALAVRQGHLVGDGEPVLTRGLRRLTHGTPPRTGPRLAADPPETPGTRARSRAAAR